MGLIGLVLFLLFITVPVMVGARIVGAGRTSFGACLGALFVAFIIDIVAVFFFHRLGLLGFFVAAFAYMLVLETSYLRGLAIALIQMVVTALLLLALALTALGTSMHLKDVFRHFETGPSQSV
jgi:hypothetical protein